MLRINKLEKRISKELKTNPTIKQHKYKLDNTYNNSVPTDSNTAIYKIKDKQGVEYILKVIRTNEKLDLSQKHNVPTGVRAIDKNRSYEKEIECMYLLQDSQYTVSLVESFDFDFNGDDLSCLIMKKHPTFVVNTHNDSTEYHSIIKKWEEVYGKKVVAAWIGFCVTSAFLDMETVGIPMHRDIKPTNLFIQSDAHIDMFLNRVLVGDFGIAHQNKSDWTTTNANIGTERYKPPEIDKDPNVFDEFSLGIVLYEFFNNFWFNKDSDSREWRKGAPLPRPKGQIDDEMLQIIQKMTMYDPEKRYLNKYELRQVFANVLIAEGYAKCLPRDDLSTKLSLETINEPLALPNNNSELPKWKDNELMNYELMLLDRTEKEIKSAQRYAVVSFLMSFLTAATMTFLTVVSWKDIAHPAAAIIVSAVFFAFAIISAWIWAKLKWAKNIHLSDSQQILIKEKVKNIKINEVKTFVLCCVLGMFGIHNIYEYRIDKFVKPFCMLNVLVCWCVFFAALIFEYDYILNDNTYILVLTLPGGIPMFWGLYLWVKELEETSERKRPVYYYTDKNGVEHKQVIKIRRSGEIAAITDSVIDKTKGEK